MRRLIFALFFSLTLITVALPVQAAKPGGDKEELVNAITKAADLHLSREGTYTNAAGGSYGPPNIPSIPNTWEWVIGSGRTAWNVGGMSATGLLAAHERTHDSRYLDGALLTGNTLVWRYNTITANGAQWEDRPFSQDVEFLVRLSTDSGDASYAAVAAQWYGIVIANKTAVQTADRYVDARKSLAGWDLASQIRAAVAVGEVAYAAGIASRLIERRAEWENVLLGGWNYTVSSHASLLWAFRALGDNTFGAYVSEIRGLTLAAQGTDGSWDDGDYQTTAYAMLGLATPRTPVNANAVEKGWVFVRDTMTVQGGWAPEYGEVNSEVLMALGSAKLDEGKKLGHTDPKPGRGNDTGKHRLPEP